MSRQSSGLLLSEVDVFNLVNFRELNTFEIGASSIQPRLFLEEYATASRKAKQKEDAMSKFACQMKGRTSGL